MLFMCHQMAMKHDTNEKEKAQLLEARRRQSVPINVPVIWVLGGPGCGKGTQCAKIVEKYNFKHFSTGDLLRAEVSSGSEKGKALEKIMKEGKLVSNNDVLILLEMAIKKASIGAQGYLIDGYPREKDQGSAFEDYIAPVDLILYFECSDETLVTRIMARAAASTDVRSDDNEATLKIRIATFNANTNKILEQYPTKTVSINAERHVDEIFLDVAAAIDGILHKNPDVVELTEDVTSLSPSATLAASPAPASASAPAPSPSSE